MNTTDNQNKHKSLQGFFQEGVRKVKHFAYRIYMSRFLFYSYKPYPEEIGHLPFTFLQFLKEVIKNREISRKIKEHFFKDRLILVAAIPKSASSVIGSCVARVQSESGYGIRSYPRYMIPNEDSDLRPELVQDFREGGVLKYHTAATGKNLKVINLLGIKHVILLRHPVDQIVAMAAHFRTGKKTADNIIFDHIYPVYQEMHGSNVDINDSINDLIHHGYLIAALSWMTDWLHFKNSEKSLVIRYEDFILKRDRVLNDISIFISGNNVDKDTIKACNLIADNYANQRTTHDSARKYPHGWTGKVGVWKNYLSNENKNGYISVVTSFLNFHPHSSLLLEVYPDLLDLDKT